MVMLQLKHQTVYAYVHVYWGGVLDPPTHNECTVNVYYVLTIMPVT